MSYTRWNHLLRIPLDFAMYNEVGMNHSKVRLSGMGFSSLCFSHLESGDSNGACLSMWLFWVLNEVLPAKDWHLSTF